MKNASLKFLSITVLLVSSLYFFQSCSKEKTEVVLHEMTLKHSMPYGNAFEFPAGTQLTIEDDQLDFKLPGAYRLIAQVGDEVVNLSEGTLKCICNVKDCSQIKEGILGCNDDNVQLLLSVTQQFQLVEEVVLANLDAPIHFLANGKEHKETETISSFVFKDAAVLKKLGNFTSQYNTASDLTILENLDSGKKLPEQMSYVPIKFLGGKVYVSLNTSNETVSKIASIFGNPTCDCTDRGSSNGTTLDGCIKTYTRISGLGWNVTCSNSHCDKCKLVLR